MNMPSLVLRTPLGSEKYLSHTTIKLRMWGFCRGAYGVCACMQMCVYLWEGEVDANCTTRGLK